MENKDENLIQVVLGGCGDGKSSSKQNNNQKAVTVSVDRQFLVSQSDFVRAKLGFDQATEELQQ